MFKIVIYPWFSHYTGVQKYNKNVYVSEEELVG